MDRILYQSSSTIDAQFVRKNRKLPWNRRQLSDNNSITIGDVIDLELPNAVKEFYIYNIVDRSTYEDIVKYNTYAWNRKTLSMKPKRFDLRILDIDLPNAIEEWYWHGIAEYASIEDVVNNKHLPWNRRSLSFGKNGIYLYHMNLDLPNAIGDWEHDMLSRCANINALRAYPNYQWNRYQISYYGYSNFHVDMMSMSLPNAIGEWKWDWARISENISMEDIMDNPHLDWNTYCILTSQHYNVKVFNVLSCGTCTMYYLCLSATIDDIKSNPLIPWNREYLSQNMSLDISVKELELPNAVGEWKEELNEHVVVSYKNAYKISDEIYSKISKWLGPVNYRLGYRHLPKELTQDDVDYILEHPEYRWNRAFLSLGRRLVYKLIDVNLPNAIGEWNWRYISKYVPIDYIVQYSLLPWNKYSISDRTDLELHILNIDMPNATGEWNLINIYSKLNIFEFMKYHRTIVDTYASNEINLMVPLPEDIILLLTKTIVPHVINHRSLADIELVFQ